MQKQVKGFLSLLCLLSVATAVADNNTCSNLTAANNANYVASTHWTERPAGQQYFLYAGAGIQDKINLFGMSEFYGVFDLTLAWDQTMQSGKNSSFFASQNGTITVGAGEFSPIEDAGTNGAAPYADPYPYAWVTGDAVDVRAADLGLGVSTADAANNYAGTLCFQPQIQNFVANLDLWMGFDEFVQGLYLRARAPLNWTRWGLNPVVTGVTNPAVNYQAGFTNQDSIVDTGAAADPVAAKTDLLSVLSGNAGSTPDDIPVLQYGRIQARDSKFGVADLPLDLGYNFHLAERSRMGISLHVVAPVGTKNDTAYLFAPRVGFGRTQIGAQLGGQYEFWNNDDQRMTFYFEAMASAMLSHKENRLLGLKAGNSYAFNHLLTLKKYTVTAGTVTDVGLERAANLLFKEIELGANVNSDIAAWVQYRNGGFDASLAWQFTGRGAEHIKGQSSKNRGDFITIDGMTFGDTSMYYVIKGDTPLYLPNADTNADGAVQAYPANPAGYTANNIIDTHFYDKTSNINTLGTPNNNTDPINAYANNPLSGAALTTALANAQFTGSDVVADPALHPSAITNAVALYLGYNWEEHDWQPFLGFVGQVEFSGSHNAAMNAWAAAIKGGVTF